MNCRVPAHPAGFYNMSVKIKIRKTEELTKGELTEAELRRVDPERREKLLRLKYDGARALSYTAGLLLAEAAKKELSLEPEEIRICRGEHEKPFLEGAEGFYYNLSHTEGLCVIAYGDEPVGADCERIRFREKDLAVAKRCFTDEEYAYIEAAGDDMHVFSERFFRIWTIKESYLKYTGEGISVALDSFCVDPEGMCVRGRTARFTEYVYGDHMIMICTASGAVDFPT